MRNFLRPGRVPELGNFATGTDQLLSLFDDPGARRPGRWRESFGYEPAARRRDAKTLLLNDCAMPISSSDC